MVSKLWSAQEFGFRVDKYITKKVKVKVSSGQDTPFGPPLHFYQNNILPQTVLELLHAQDFSLREDNYLTKKVRVVSLSGDMPTGPPLHSYQILPKYI